MRQLYYKKNRDNGMRQIFNKTWTMDNNELHEIESRSDQFRNGEAEGSGRHIDGTFFGLRWLTSNDHVKYLSAIVLIYQHAIFPAVGSIAPLQRIRMQHAFKGPLESDPGTKVPDIPDLSDRGYDR
ncbi:unnamed protein product [Haemonchus placei]|uniref:Uncharacterized protein n=1 Tax=Haemonchus placei TaxID=6290 RepID=A0A0N4W4F3_HAEPC|nr:unnamed protein product [Haemonchus placei]